VTLHPWIQAAVAELDGLDPHTHAPDDAWRVLVLVGRVLGAPDSPGVPAAVLGCVSMLATRAGPTNAPALLDDLAEALEDDSDPMGPLLDAMLNVDDALTVSQLEGKTAFTEELGARAAALVSVWPERVLALSTFAEMRIATTRSDHGVRALWRAVQQAPAELLAAHLPAARTARTAAPVTPRHPVPPRRPRGSPVVRHFDLPRQSVRAAAASTVSTTVEVGEGAWLHSTPSQCVLELELAGAGTTDVWIEVRRRGEEAILTTRTILVRHSRAAVEARLGPASIWEDLAREVDHPLEALEFQLVVRTRRDD